MNKKNIAKYLIIGIFLCFSLTLRVEAKQSLQDASLKYATMQAVKGAVERLKDKKIPEIIIPETPEHEDRKISKTKTKELVPDLLNKSFDEDLDYIYQNIVKQSNIDYSIREYKKEARERYAEKINTNISNISSEQFDDYFKKIRDKAYKLQLSRLTSVAYPNQNEVEIADNKEWTEVAKTDLTNLIIERYKGTAKVLFSENRETAEPKAEKMVEAIIIQLKKQQNALNGNIPNNAITQIKISKKLHNNIQTAISEMKKQANKEEKIYKIFPSVEKNILPKATLIEKERFKLFIKNYNFSVNNEKLKETIQSDLKRHRNYSKSLELLSKNLFPGAAEEVVNAYSGKIKTSSEHQDFRNRLKLLISKNEEVRSNLISAISNEIKTPLKQDIRPTVAKEQLKEHFYPIFSGEWAVPENILKKLAYKKYGVNSFGKCLKLPFISRGSEPYNRNSLLDETKNEVLKKVGKLLSEGKRAWEGQEDIIKGKRNEIINEGEQIAKKVGSWEKQSDIIDKADLTEKKINETVVLKTEDQWVDYYTKQVETKWIEERVNKIWRGFNIPPTNSPTKYSPLFGHMREEIKMIVHSFFETTNKKIEEQQKKIKKRIELRRKEQEEAKKKLEEKLKREDARKKNEEEQKRLEDARKKEEEEKKRIESARKKEEAEQKKIEAEQKKIEAEQKKIEEDRKNAAAEKAESGNGLQEGPTGGGEEDGPANMGGEQSVEDGEKGGGAAQNPQLGGVSSKWPWWMWALIILIIILIIGLIVWLILLYRKNRRLMRANSLLQNDFKISVNNFSQMFNSEPNFKSDNEVIFEGKDFIISLRKNE